MSRHPDHGKRADCAHCEERIVFEGGAGGYWYHIQTDSTHCHLAPARVDPAEAYNVAEPA